MNEVIEAFRRLIPSGSKTSGGGWLQFNCPACGDKRNRGGFKETPTGGFRYRCQNGGCPYEQKTGWEPDNGFMGRPRRLFEVMNGDISQIPKTLLDGPNRHRSHRYDLDQPEERLAWIEQMQADWLPEAAGTKLWKPRDEVALDFPEAMLPHGTEYLWDATNPDACDVQAYAEKRCRSFLSQCVLGSSNPLCWSPKYKRHVVLPFVEKNKIVGWIARKIDPGKEYAHIKCPKFPSDYMLNQHLRYRYKTVLVMQGAFDALALRGLCTFGSVLSKKQITLLNQLKTTGRKIVLIPDFKKSEWQNYLSNAKDQGWFLSIPDTWGADGYSPEDYIKDPGDCIARHGLLYTMEMVMDSITDNYSTAEIILEMRSR